MESVWTAVKSTFRKRSVPFGKTLRRWSLKTLRNAIDRADTWCHRQEVGFREQVAGNSEYAAEMDPVASALREKHRSGQAAYTIVWDGCKTAGKTTPLQLAVRRHVPRLKYQHGEFVEVNR
jgi:hypothetical protein